MKTVSTKVGVVAIVVVSVLAMLLGGFAHHGLNKSKPLVVKAATVFPQPRALSAFTLRGDNKKPFTNKNLQGHWSLVFFGFTHCPMVCPTTLSLLNKSYQKIKDTQVVFISVDTRRDTPASIHRYLSGFNKRFVGATGTKKQIDRLTQEFSVVYMGGTTIDHSGTITLLNPKGQIVAVFTTPHDANLIANDVQAIQAHYRGEA